MLRQQAFDGDFRFLHFRRIVLVLHRQADFRFFEAIEHVAGRDRTQADVVDLADGRLFFDLDNQAPALGSLFARKADVFEVAGIPQER